MKSFKSLGLIEPLFAMTTTGMLLALLLMGRSSIQEAAHRRACASNLRKIGQAMYIYAQDEPHVFPAISVTRIEQIVALIITCLPRARP